MPSQNAFCTIYKDDIDLSAGRQYQRYQDIIDVFAKVIDIVIDNVTRLQNQRCESDYRPRPFIVQPL